MSSRRISNDTVHWFLAELTSSIVAKSGRPSDRYHLGKMILESFRRYPNNVLQIDGVTNESITNAEVAEKSIRCANAMKTMGLGVGDVIALLAPCHLDLNMPFYAALYLGVVVFAVDKTLQTLELQSTFRSSKPKIIFCQEEKVADIQKALDSIGHEARLVTFDGGDHPGSFTHFLDQGHGTSSVDFECSEFDGEEALAFLIGSSGSMGIPKVAAATHKSLTITQPYLWSCYRQFPTPTRLVLIVSPIQWLTALSIYIVSPLFSMTKLQIACALSPDLFAQLINKYRPSYSILSPNFLNTFIQQLDVDGCDISCIETFMVGGNAVPPDLCKKIQEISPETRAYNAYGMSELTGLAFTCDDISPSQSCGRPLGCWQYRLVDIITGKDVLEPNSPGELWMKGPGLIKEYYNDPAVTMEAFTEDRWFQTGDIFYKDEAENYYFVERTKMLLKYESVQISPVEVENVIRKHPGVMDVAVTGIPDPTYGDLVVAAVVARKGVTVDPDEIKQLVKDLLSDAKQLRGGVVFLNELPVLPTTKINRKKLKEIVINMVTPTRTKTG